MEKIKCKRAFISDTHIGSIACKSEELYEFLSNLECKELYLIGDIIDGWRLKKKFKIDQKQVNLTRKFLSLAKQGTKVYWITGNHDEFLRKYSEFFPLEVGNIKIVNKAVVTLQGKKFLLIHGDAFDTVIRYYGIIAHLGDTAYDFLIWLNFRLNQVRKLFGMKYWSLSKAVKNRVKKATNYIFAFEETATKFAKQQGFDGIMCGHIHKPELTEYNGICYYNTGDWVENCSAIIERQSGKVEVIDNSGMV